MGGSLVGQTPVVVVLQDIFDLIVSALGGDERYPRPVTAVAAEVERVREERTLAAAHDVIAAMTPWAM
ncbi:MAG: hypothetical protein Q4C85_08645 [Actinomyces sp.]|uniref:Uncharacterized protein n=1 Tax=Actinomyces howellii TaxID=52771 RepID=A0A3S4UXD5_9ACTO|nr:MULTISPECIES: hypothetical protein [Actinomyces]MDO4243806.1 hypothetical protein [Actinomyces sp.]VEG28049.1 Uncharacterised protein [Actinomyces howellii]